MKIDFRDKRLRALCEEQRVAVRELGADSAKKLRARLSDLDAATRVTDLVAGRPHPLKFDRAGQFAVDLAGGWRLVFAPDHDPLPLHADGSVDWSQVSSVIIESIEDYHD